MAFPVEVMSVGTWNGVKFTPKDLLELAENFKKLKDVVKPPIKLGHSGDQTGKPALGWVTDLKVKGNKLIAFVEDVPSILMKAIKKKLYRTVSSEIFSGFKYKGKRYGKVFSGLAFLGAEMPAVKDLEDLTAYLSQTSDGEFEKVSIIEFTTKEDESEEEMDKKLEEKVIELTQTVEGLKVEVRDKEKRNKDLLAEIEKRDAVDIAKFRDGSQTDFEKFCEAQIKAKKMSPGQKKVLFAEKDVLVFSDKTAAIPVDVFKKFVEAGSEVLDDNSRVKNDDKKKTFSDPQEEVDRRAQEYCDKHPKTDYADAVAIVLREDEELAKKYSMDFSAVVPGSDE